MTAPKHIPSQRPPEQHHDVADPGVSPYSLLVCAALVVVVLVLLRIGRRR